MKISIIPGVFFPYPGGAQVQAHNISNILTEKKIKVDLFLFKNTNILKKKYTFKIFNSLLVNLVYYFHYYLNINLIFLLKLYLKNIINKQNYKCWHFIFLHYKSLLIINALYELNQKIVVTFQGADIQIKRNISYGNRLDKKYDKFLKLSINKINFFTTISNNIYKDLLNLKISKNKILKIPNNIYLKNFTKRCSKQNPLILKIITVARYSSKKKGYDLMPIIVQKLLKNKVNFHWTVIGKGTSYLKKYKIINKNIDRFNILENIQDRKTLYFPSIEIIKKYQQSDIYCNLARIESFGISFIEALASNIPIITFDTKGANEIVKNNINGYIIKNNNINKFVNILKKFSKRKKVFGRTPLSTSKVYSFEKCINKYIKIYQSL